MRTGSADAVSASTTADAHRPLQLTRNCVSLNSRLKMFKGFKNLGTCTLYISVFRLVSVLIDVHDNHVHVPVYLYRACSVLMLDLAVWDR